MEVLSISYEDFNKMLAIVGDLPFKFAAPVMQWAETVVDKDKKSKISEAPTDTKSN